MRALAEPVINFSAFSKCRFTYSDNVLPVGERISRLVCTVNRKAESECDVE